MGSNLGSPWARVHYGPKLGPPVAHDGPDHAEGPLWAPNLGSPWARVHYGPKLGRPVAHGGPNHARAHYGLKLGTPQGQGLLRVQTWAHKRASRAHMTPIFGPMGPWGPRYAPGAGPYGAPTILTSARTYGTILTIAPQNSSKYNVQIRAMQQCMFANFKLYKCANEAAQKGQSSHDRCLSRSASRVRLL
jgi:hypothetical protein